MNRNIGAFVRSIKGGRFNLFPKTGVKRGLDIGVNLNIPTTTKHDTNLERLENVLEKALGGRLKEVLNTSGCPSCDEEIATPIPEPSMVKPAFECDEWDSRFRICILERNIGDTVTFYLSTGTPNGRKPNVTWRKEFHLESSNIRTDFVIDAENSPENIIIGRKGYELRISPITEIDLGYNIFSATLIGPHSPTGKVSFVIRVVPIDLGFVYVGETIELNLRSFVSLPAESLNFRWYMEKDGEHGTLPSNMRVSASGSSIKISELRQEQEGILSCSVYTNLHFLATKKRFLMKDLVKNNDVLKSTPDHNLFFKEDSYRGKRDPKMPVRIKRDEEVDDIVEKAFMESTPATKRPVKLTESEITAHSYNDYDLGMDVGNREPKMETNNLGENRLQDLNQPVNDKGYSQKTKGSDISLDNNHVEFEKTQDNIPLLDNSPQLESSMGNQPMLDKTALVKKPYNPHSSYQQQSSSIDKIPIDRNRQDNGLKSYEMSELQESISPKKITDKNRQQYDDIDIENKKTINAAQNGDSEIILNIDKIPGPRRISAEEKIAKLISSCYSDFQCSGSAICVRSNLKLPGFCKCLPGFYGVGIFCREDIWISKSNFDIEELHNPDDMSYFGSSTDVSEE